jgi:hypothetical protein
MSLTETLSRAIEAGEVLFVKYHGGSKPGESRQLSPIAFVGDDKIRAHCHASGRNKVFVIDKIEILEDVDHGSATYESAPFPSDPKTLAEALAGNLDGLRDAGWHVEIEAEFCSLHRYFKNGKPRKTPVVSIEFREFTWNYDENADGGIDEDGILIPIEKKSERPWCVSCAELDKSVSFKSLSGAADRFLEWAGELSSVSPT